MLRAVEPEWLTIARRDLGSRETLGPNDSPLIRRMWASLSGSWLLGQPWCGGAMAWWMQQAGIEYPKAYYRARAWLDWGVKLSTPAYGCVAVLERKGGGHVGIVTGETADWRLVLLGGNQGNAVTEATFERDRVLGYRWPIGGEVRTGQFRLPIVKADASRGEA